MKKLKRVVVKIGSQVLTRPDGTLDTARMASLVNQFAVLQQSGMELVVVSSGAVASGRGEIGSRASKLDPVSSRQLFSAVGQVKLINHYYNMFREADIACGQVLTTKESLSTRRDYLNQRNCLEVMLRNGVVPIINENDTISVSELMFTDNDELSGMVATMMGAQALVILSNIDGIYDGDPKLPGSKVIAAIEPGKRDLSQYISAEKSQFGRGGMLTKSRIAARVADEGVEVVIANGTREGILTSLLLGHETVPCTRFKPAEKGVSSLKKWIAHSEGFASGALHINAGALDALRNSKAVSLLPVGVEKVAGEFEKDDIVAIVAPDGTRIGVGRVSADSAKAKALAGKKGGRALVHYDYMYLI